MMAIVIQIFITATVYSFLMFSFYNLFTEATQVNMHTYSSIQ